MRTSPNALPKLRPFRLEENDREPQQIKSYSLLSAQGDALEDLLGMAIWVDFPFTAGETWAVSTLLLSQCIHREVHCET